MAASTVCEEWRPVPSFEGWYSVSNLGRVRCEFSTSHGDAGNVLSPTINAHGYCRVKLRNDVVKQDENLVHWLVAEAFIGPRPRGYHINHIDGDKTNNRATNLEYVTPLGNRRHAIEVLGMTGIVGAARGENHPRAKLTASKVVEIKRRLNNGDTPTAIARDFGVSKSAITSIKSRRCWAHID